MVLRLREAGQRDEKRKVRLKEAGRMDENRKILWPKKPERTWEEWHRQREESRPFADVRRTSVAHVYKASSSTSGS